MEKHEELLLVVEEETESGASVGEADAHDADAEACARLLELVGQRQEPAIPQRIDGVVIGRLLALDGQPVVVWAGAPNGARARAAAVLNAAHVGRQVALLFEGGDPRLPLVVGVVEPLPSPPALEPETLPAQTSVAIDGNEERVVLEAKQQLVLRCGKASITLTRSGKILIRGAHVSSAASGMNRIVGGAVEIN